MTHYAKVNNGIVEQVIVAEADFFTNGHFVDTSPGTWVETSYNTRNGVHYSPITNTPDGGTPLSCLLYTSPSPRDRTRSRMPSSA